MEGGAGEGRRGQRSACLGTAVRGWGAADAGGQGGRSGRARAGRTQEGWCEPDSWVPFPPESGPVSLAGQGRSTHNTCLTPRPARQDPAGGPSARPRRAWTRWDARASSHLPFPVPLQPGSGEPEPPNPIRVPGGDHGHGRTGPHRKPRGQWRGLRGSQAKAPAENPERNPASTSASSRRAAEGPHGRAPCNPAKNNLWQESLSICQNKIKM